MAAFIDEQLVEIIEHITAEQLAIVVAHMGILIQPAPCRLDCIPELFVECFPEPVCPHPLGIDFPRIEEQRGLPACKGPGEGADECVEVALDGVGVDVVEDVQRLSEMRVFPRPAQPLGGGAVECERRIFSRNYRPAEGPERADGEIASEADARGVGLGVLDKPRPSPAEETYSRLRIGKRVHPRDFDSAEAVVEYPV